MPLSQLRRSPLPGERACNRRPIPSRLSRPVCRQSIRWPRIRSRSSVSDCFPLFDVARLPMIAALLPGAVNVRAQTRTFCGERAGLLLKARMMFYLCTGRPRPRNNNDSSHRWPRHPHHADGLASSSRYSSTKWQFGHSYARIGKPQASLTTFADNSPFLLAGMIPATGEACISGAPGHFGQVFLAINTSISPEPATF